MQYTIVNATAVCLKNVSLQKTRAQYVRQEPESRRLSLTYGVCAVQDSNSRSSRIVMTKVGHSRRMA